MADSKVIYYKTDEEIELMRQSNLLVCKVHEYVASNIRPGMTGLELDKIAEEMIRDHGATPSFKGYGGFPNSLCISPNEVVVHGIPNDKPFKDGDVISVDCGAFLNGYHGDSAYTYALGDVKEETMQLLRVTNTSLYVGIEAAKVGKRIGDISFAIQNFTQRIHRCSVVRELVGHGVGRKLHEAPEVPNYGKKGKGAKIQVGMTIAIEPMINLGRKEIVQADDGWTISTRDKKPSAHFEHSIAILASGPQPLSDHSRLEENIRKNPNVKEVELLLDFA